MTISMQVLSPIFPEAKPVGYPESLPSLNLHKICVPVRDLGEHANLRGLVSGERVGFSKYCWMYSRGAGGLFLEVDDALDPMRTVLLRRMRSQVLCDVTHVSWQLSAAVSVLKGNDAVTSFLREHQSDSMRLRRFGFWPSVALR